MSICHGNTIAARASDELLNYKIMVFEIAGFC